MFKKGLTPLLLLLLFLAPMAEAAGNDADAFTRPSPKAESAPMKTQSWKLPADFFRGPHFDEVQPHADGSYDDERVIKILKDCGVIFRKGSTASYKGGKLTVLNTPESLKLTQKAIDDYWSRQPDIYKATWKISRDMMKGAASDLKQEMREREREGFESIKVSGTKVTAVGPEHSINDLGNYLEKSYEAELNKKKCLGKKGQNKSANKRGKKD